MSVDSRPNPSNPPTKNVDNGSTIYQGEEVTVVGDLVGNEQLTGVAGNAEDEFLDLSVPIPEDQTPGSYTVTGDARGQNNPGVRITEPRIIDNEIRLGSGGTDVSGETVSTQNADDLRVWAQYNFDSAESLEVTVEDSDGTDITNAVMSNPTIAQSEDHSGAIDLSDEDAGEYTVIVEGADDLDFGNAAVEMTISTSSQDELSIEAAEESVTQGDNVDYTVSGGTSGDFHVVTIDSSDFRDGFSVSDAASVFRNVADTDSVGVYANGAYHQKGSIPGSVSPGDIEYATAVVEIDGTTAQGSIDTQYLSDTDVDITVYDQSTPAAVTSMTEADDFSLTVEEGSVSLDNPTGAYIVGSQVNVNGTATSSDEVAIYVRDQTDWEILDLDSAADSSYDRSISVDSDDSFEMEDVQISTGDGGGNDILSLAGTYRIGVIDAADASIDSANPDDELTTSEFNSGTSASQSIRVTDGELSGQFVTVNGQVAQEDGDLDINGTATGQDQVVVAFVDERGNTAAQTISVESDGTFEEEGVDVSSLSQGTVSAHIISIGRDNTFGDGDLPGFSADSHNDMVSWIQDLGTRSLSGNQVRDRITAETTEDTASDDKMVTSTFRLAEASTTIESVYPEVAESSGVNPVASGETMVVTGMTNKRSDDNVITVEVLNEDGESVALADTDSWGNDGMWSVSIDTSDIETGTYVVESDDGDSTDRAEVEIVDERTTPTTEATTEETTQETTQETTEETTEATTEETTEQTTEQTTEETTEETTTEEQTPGFGAVVAVIALLAAALLAVRRE